MQKLAGFQIADGLAGAIIVRQPRYADPHSSLYDHDLYSHTIVVMDWMHNLADEKFPGFKSQSQRGFKADSYLIDGLGSYTIRKVNFYTRSSRRIRLKRENSNFMPGIRSQLARKI